MRLSPDFCMGFDLSDCTFIVFVFVCVLLIIQYFDGGGGGIRQASTHPC